MWLLCFTLGETKTFPKVFMGLILILPPILIWELCGIMTRLVIWQGVHTQSLVAMDTLNETDNLPKDLGEQTELIYR